MKRFIIVGAGQAGLQVAESLRRGGFDGEVLLVGEEASLPYQRPPLSKKYLLGEVEAPRLLFRPADHYAKLGIACHLGVPVAKLDKENRIVYLADGAELCYDRLALTTGARVRELTVPGAGDPRVCYLRGLNDAENLRVRLSQARRVAIIGGGFIGLEVAAIARGLGCEVAVLETQSRVLQRVVAPVVSDFFARIHRERGVNIQLAQQVSAIDATPDALTIITADGSSVVADLIVAGIGVLPNIELARASGLLCDGGIVVDEFARTSDPSIVSAGDCTMHRNLLYPRPHRIESVQNAVDQAKVAAGTLLDHPVAYAQVPWFWSDQYDFKLQMTGISTGYDELVLRGEPEKGAFSVFYYADERLIAADSINRPAEHMVSRKLIATPGGCYPKAQLADTAIDLKTIF